MAKTGNLHYATAGVEGGWGGPGTGLLGVSQRRRTDPVNWRVGLRAAGTTLFRSLPSTIKLPTPAGLWQKQEICTTPQREWRVGGGVPERACWGFPNAVGRTQSIGGWACGLPEQPCSALCPLQLSCPPQRDYGKNRKSALRHSGSGGWVGGSRNGPVGGFPTPSDGPSQLEGGLAGCRNNPVPLFALYN